MIRRQRKSDQNASELTTSPTFLLPMAHQVCMLMELLTNRTLPSAISVFTRRRR